MLNYQLLWIAFFLIQVEANHPPAEIKNYFGSYCSKWNCNWSRNMVYPNSCNTTHCVLSKLFQWKVWQWDDCKIFYTWKNKIYLFNEFCHSRIPERWASQESKIIFFFMACNDQSLNRLPREDEMDIVLRYFNDVGIFEALFLFSIFKATK